ncbi:hypothetical protein [Streptomyces sp900116325]|uniref:Uncharacterized protein n=1 Tax=Streptomyces sp. 900116325 TaxID=3154295 RepID=A0ABV2UHC8_9ACTN
MQHRVAILGREGADLSVEIGRVVHDGDVSAGQTGDAVDLGTGADGGDHPGAVSGGQLHG